jgi:hypothetical protein
MACGGKGTRRMLRLMKSPGKISVTIRFAPPILKRLDALANRKGTDRTAQIQLAVAEWLDKEGNRP